MSKSDDHYRFAEAYSVRMINKELVAALPSDSTRSDIAYVGYATADLTTRCTDSETSMMITNDYAAGQIVGLGSVYEVVRGSAKGLPLDDGPGQPRRDFEIEDVD